MPQTSTATGLPVPVGRRRGRRRYVAVATATLLAATLAACGGGGDSGETSADAKTLTIAFQAAPSSLELPTNCSSPMLGFAYEPLIRVTSDGKYGPGIAESWEYSNNNTEFTMKIRTGVKFDDGTPLDATSVVNTLKYFQVTPGLNQGYLKPFTSIEAPDATTVNIKYNEPFRGMETLLASDGECNNGMTISAAGLADPAKMKSDTFGAGPYDLDPAATVAGDHYTYTKNPNYFDTARQNYDKIVVRIIADPTTALNALATDQVQVNMVGGETLIDQVKGQGGTVTQAQPQGPSIFLLDRDGAVVPALKDIRVRQALGFALDRAAIAPAMGSTSKPLNQFGLAGAPGYSETLDSAFTFDLPKAKQLMADAGYPDGFELTIATPTQDTNGAPAVQAATQQWQALGVKATLKQIPITDYFTQLATKAYPTAGISFGMLGDVYFDAVRLYKQPYSVVWNPFLSTDPDLDTAYEALATATSNDQIEGLSVEFNKVMTEKAWYIPIVQTFSYVFAKGVDVGTASPLGAFDYPSWHPTS